MAKVTFDDELDATMRELEADKNSMFMNLKHYHERRESGNKNAPQRADISESNQRAIYARCDGGTDKVPL